MTNVLVGPATESFCRFLTNRGSSSSDNKDTERTRDVGARDGVRELVCDGAGEGLAVA
jgi:hypothetical protein